MCIFYNNPLLFIIGNQFIASCSCHSLFIPNNFSKIHFIFEHIWDCCDWPEFLFFFVFSVHFYTFSAHILPACKHMGFVQIFCYLSFGFPICRHCEYQFHCFSRFWIYNQMMLIFWIFNISIFGKSRHIFTVFSMCFHRRTNFSGQISAVHCVQHIF